MKSTSILYAAILLLSAFAFVPSIPTAAADDGGLLLDGGLNLVYPGNPCGAVGPHGGVAVDTVTGKLFYSTRDAPRVYVTRTTAPHTCLGIFTISGAPAGEGFRRLSFDRSTTATQGLLWAAVDDGSGRVLRIDWASASVTGQYAHPAGSGDVNGIASEKVSPFRNVMVLSNSNVARYFSDAGVDLGPVTLQGVGSVRGLATWGPALLAGDMGYTLRFHDAAGASTGRAFRPHVDYADEFYQPAKSYYNYWWDDVALDEVSYAGLGKVALFTIQGNEYMQCVRNCQDTICLERDNEGACLAYGDICDGVPGPCTGPPVEEPRSRVLLQAHQILVDPDCPNPIEDCDETPPCDPPSPASNLVVTAPLARVHIDGVPTATAHTPPLAYGSAIEIRVTSSLSGTSKMLEITGPMPGLPATLYGTGATWSYTLPLATAAPGAQTLTIIESDLADACRPQTTITTRIQVAKPYLESFAQGARVAGNLPLDLIAGTAPQDPRTTLLAREFLRVAGWNGVLATPTLAGTDASTPVRASALEALAEHGPIAPRPVSTAAHGRTEVAGFSTGPGSFDVCPAPPTVCNSGALPARSRSLVVTDAYAEVNVDTGSRVVTAVSDLEDALAASFCLAGVPDCGETIVTPAGTIRWKLHEHWTRSGAGWAEAYANAARITIDMPPLRGEIVIGEAYAAASIVGATPLLGRPRFMEEQDDFDMGGDAPATGGPLRASGVYGGTFRGSDVVDSVKVTVNHLQKVQVTLSPAQRVDAYASTLPTPPTRQVTPRPISLTLIDPNGVVRDQTFIGAPSQADARPSKVELNADVQGDWVVVVRRHDPGVEHAYYGLAIAVTPLVHTAFDAHPAHPNAGAACGSGPVMPAPVVTGWLPHTEAADVWALPTLAGDQIAITLKPAYDADGADFDLHLYDAVCQPAGSSATSGSATIPKGAPESLATTSTGGTYWVVVTRENGVGNYVLEAAATGP